MVHGDAGRGDKVLERIVAATYESCRSKSKDVDGFPDFAPLLAELQTTSPNQSGTLEEQKPDTFKVSVQQASGALVIKECFHKQFGDLPQFQSLLEQHNDAYNPEGLRLSEPSAGSGVKQEDKVQKTVLITPDDPLTAQKVASLPNASLPQGSLM